MLEFVAMNNADVATLVVEYLFELLETESPVTLDDDFFDLGGDSFAAVDFTNFVSDVINGHVSVKLIYDAPLLRDYVAALDTIDSSP